MIENLIFRPPHLDDAQQTLDMMIRCDIHDSGQADSVMEDLVNDWNKIDLNKDAWLVLTPEQNVVGYASVNPWGADLKYDLLVDPMARDKDVIHALLSRCEARGAEVAKGREQTGKMKAKCYVVSVNQPAGEVLTELGFQVTKYVFNMQAQFDAPPPSAQLPADISIRNPIPGQDDRMIYEVIQSAFERPGRTKQVYEDWRGFMLRPNVFKPELWFLAMKDSEMVGACLCYEYSGSDEGWVRQLGVLETVRRTGLGGALLHHAFAEFYKRGLRKVGLAVESDNLRAIRFYENVGMKQIRRYDEHVKII